MQPSHSSAKREGYAGGDGMVLLWTVAAFLWAVSIVAVLWLEDYRDASTELGVASVVLVLVVMPAAFGAATCWHQPARVHRGRASAWAGVLAEWSFLAVAAAVSLVTHWYTRASYLLNFNRAGALDVGSVVDFVFPPIGFGLAGAIMGFAGGVVAMRVRRRIARKEFV